MPEILTAMAIACLGVGHGVPRVSAERWGWLLAAVLIDVLAWAAP